MKQTMHVAGLAGIAIASLLAAPIVAAAGDAFELNHYILGCDSLCPDFINSTPAPPDSRRPALDVVIGSPGAVATDFHGNVYFASPGVVFKLDASGIVTRVAGTGSAGFSGDGGAAQDARLNNMPYEDYMEARLDFLDYSSLVGGLAVDVEGNLYIGDSYNNRVRRVDTSGNISTVMELGWPEGLAVDSTGMLYAVSQWGTVATLARDGTVAYLTGANCGPGFLGPGVCVPEGIALDAKGGVYVTDGYCRVRRVDPDGSTVTVAGDDTDPSGGWAFTCGLNGDAGQATKMALQFPYAVAIDNLGNLIVADTWNHCIRQVDASGWMTTIAGSCGNTGFAGDGGPAKEGLLDLPYAVATDGAGNIFVADSGNHRIRKIDTDGIITTVAGNGQAVAAPTIDSSFTGSWYDPDQRGQGLSIQVLGFKVLVYWFGFTPDGAQQTWLVGEGHYKGNMAVVSPVIMPTGGKWIPNFNPTEVVDQKWGDLALSFTDHDHGRVDFRSWLGYGSGTMDVTRLTQPNSAGWTGSWYDPAQSGHGLVLEALPGNRLLAEWFAYDPAGTQQVWFTGVGTYDGKTATIPNVVQPTGGRWTPNLDPSRVVNKPWGTLKFTFSDDCMHGRVEFVSTAGYGTGGMDLTRLTGGTCP